MSALDHLMTQREMLNQFSTEFASKHTELEAELEAVHQKLNEAIQEEEAETAAISDVQEQLGEMALEKDLEDLEDAQGALDTKFKTYKALVDANDKKAAAVVELVSESQPLIDNIKKTIGGINKSVSSIHDTIESLRSKPKVTAASS